MKKYVSLWCLMLMMGTSLLMAETKSNSDFNPFYFSSRAAEGTVADCSYMNTPITEKQRISVGKDGHLYADGKRIRIFGTNVSAFPPVEDAEYWAKTLASQGINCIRFHHTDADWSNCFYKHNSSNWQKIEFDEKAFERFDKFFYELKKVGIYSNINLLTGRTIIPDSKNGLPAELEKVADWKDRHCYGFWNETAKKEQQAYAQKILNHKNPYTGLTYAQDPAVAFVEINNENSMTKGFLDNVLERYPKKLSQELDVLWTDFLLGKGLDYNALVQKYNQSQSAGENLLSGVTTLEQHNGAKAELSENNGHTKINIKSNGKENWHIQYDYFGFQTEAEQMYTISFKAKASKETTVSVSVMMNHDPWRNLGFDKSIKLTKQWQNFSFTVATMQPDAKPRLTFGNMGQSAGTTVELSDVTLYKGGDVVFVEKGSSGNNSVKFPSFDTYRAYPAEFKQLVAEFLVKLDSDYWGSMNDYLKETLGIKALTFGTALPCAPVTVMSKFDVVDSHAYWNHPSFPGSGWDTRNYYVKNASLVNAKDGGTLAGLAKMRVYGKPFSVTEYDHPYPNQYSSEMMPMLAVMASLQDWDCIYSFCYELSQRNPQKQRITGYFDQASNPAKIAAMPFAARIFREFKIKPFEKAIYYVVTPESEAGVIAKMGSAWNNVPPEGFGANQKAALMARLGCFVTTNQNYKALDKDFIKVDDRKTITLDAAEDFDNGGLYWDAVRGYFVFNNEDVYVSVTKPGAKPELELLPGAFTFVPADDFAVVAGVKTDEAKWFIFSCCWSGNKGEKLFEYGKSQKSVPDNSIIRGEVNLSTSYSGSGSLALALGSTGSLELANKKFKLYPLQQDGNRASAKKKTELSPDDKTLWYVLEK